MARARIVDLFAGAGGFSLGFHAAGATILAAVDVNESAGSTLAANFAGLQPAAPPRLFTGDEGNLEDLDLTQIADEPPDILVGGPPCQGFSRVGRAKLASLNDDPDTGDPRNELYRRFVDALEGEIRRSDRSGRPFALLVLDLDDLKKINDRYGHLVGTRALCRLADVLRIHCRAVDTAARFGGDEFALILIETGEASARRVARRIARELAADGEKPEVSVSVGVAVYPQDGDAVETVLRVADSSMYETKRRARVDPKPRTVKRN